MTQSAAQTNRFTDPIFKQLDYLISSGGPEPHEYPMVDEIVRQIHRDKNNERVSDEDIDLLRGLFDEELLDETLQGRALKKPLGYAGDYQMIDHIYTGKVSERASCRKWDIYFQSQSAPIAVRNRKDYFKQTLREIIVAKSDPIELLNVACGPARDLAELYESIHPEKLHTTCIDMDERAIEFAREMISTASDQIEFIHCNVFKFRPRKKFDVIWSAGLFDYFADRAFTLMLKKFLKWLKDDGEIIVGNFSPNNPSRPYMEVVGDWNLHHRDEAQLMEIAREAGAGACRVEMEPEGVNLFLRTKKD